MAKRKWDKTVARGYGNLRYTTYESDAHVITDDDVRPPLVPQAEWMPWALYRKAGGGRLSLLGRFESVPKAMAAARRDQ